MTIFALTLASIILATKKSSRNFENLLSPSSNTKIKINRSHDIRSFVVSLNHGRRTNQQPLNRITLTDLKSRIFCGHSTTDEDQTTSEHSYEQLSILTRFPIEATKFSTQSHRHYPRITYRSFATIWKTIGETLGELLRDNVYCTMTQSTRGIPHSWSF